MSTDRHPDAATPLAGVRVIGLGNPILTDDGVGIYVARLVRRLLPAGMNVEVVELATGGLGLMEAMIGCERVILIDAIWLPEEAPGRVLHFTAEALPVTLNSAAAHDIDLPGALAAGRRLGVPLPTDDAILIVAVTAREVLTFGERPTPPVLAAIPQAAVTVLEALGCPPDAVPPVLNESMLGGYDDIA
ncbi:MAG: hydrogenase maturation protease [Anaerolineae bacterium]|nr:hydrogenase maturation protease [Anaerolineae bacterium]